MFTSSGKISIRGGITIITKNTPLRKDWLLIGAISGATVATVGEIFRTFLQRVGVPTVRYASIASDFMLGKKSTGPANKAEWVIGWISHAAIGSLYGTGLSYAYAITPPGNETVKGAIGGIAYWTASIGISSQLGIVKLQPFQLINTLVSTLIFGSMHGAIIGRYGSKMITQSHPIIVKEINMQEFDRSRFAEQPPASTKEVRVH